MRPSSQPFQRTAMTPQLVYSQQTQRHPQLVNQYVILPKNGVTQVPQSIQMRPITTSQQTNGTMPMIHRTITPGGQTIMAPIMTPPASSVNQGASKLSAFLKQLLDLSQKTVAPGTHTELIKLMQQLVDRQVTPEDFCSQLQAKLKCGTAKTKTEISSLVEENIDALRCDLFYGTSQIPGITPPAKNTIGDLLQRHQQQQQAVFQQQPTTVTTRPTIITSQPPTRFNNNAAAAVATQKPGQRFVTATQHIPTTAGTPQTATFYTSSTVGQGNTIVSSTGGIASGPKFLISGPGSTGQTATLIPQPGLIASRGAAGGATMVVASNGPQGTLFQSQTGNTSMTVRQEGGILTSIPVSATGAPLGAKIASLSQPQANLRPSLSTTVIAAKPEVLDSGNVSANDQPFFPINTVIARMKQSIPPGKVTMVSDDSAAVLAHGLHTFTRHLLQRLALVVQHRTERLADDTRLEATDAVRDQLTFLQRLDEHDQVRQSDIEKELIFKAARSRSKNEDPDQARVKEIAKRLQNEDYEREKQRQANLTALSAIGGPTKKRRLDELDTSGGGAATASALLASKRTASLVAPSPSTVTQLGPGGSRLSLVPAAQVSIAQMAASSSTSAPRIGSVGSLNNTEAASSSASALMRYRRANLRDLQFVLSKHHMLNKSGSYFRTYWR